MRTIHTALFIAYKSIIKSNKGMLALMIFILSLSYLNMMFVSGILFGLQDLFKETIINLVSAHLTISPQQEPQLKSYILNQDEVRQQLEAIPDVVATARHYLLAGSLSFDKQKNGVFKSVSGAIVGIDPIQEKKVLGVHTFLIRGEFLDEIDTDQVVISAALAGGYGNIAPNDLGGVQIGDKIQITYSNGVMRTYTVKGIYNDQLGLYETFISAKEAESVLDVYNSASQILVKTDLKQNPIGYYQSEIRALFPNLKLQNYNDLLGSFASFLDALLLITVIVSTISVLVAAVTIFVLIYVNAINKQRQIGILKAIGIKQEIIILSYVFQSIFFVMCSVITGSVVVFGILTPLLARYPIDVEFGKLSLVHRQATIIWGAISFLATSLLAGYIPSRLVAKKDILKAIWN